MVTRVCVGGGGGCVCVCVYVCVSHSVVSKVGLLSVSVTFRIHIASLYIKPVA